MQGQFRTPMAVAMVVAATGCSSIRTNVDYDPAADFAKLHSYDWRPDQPQGQQDPRVDNSLLASRVHAAVDRELAAKGYTKAASGKPDFLVGYHAVVEGKVDFRTVGGYYGIGWGTAPQTYAFNYNEGTLLIDVIDPDNSKLLWRGSATATVEPDASPQQRDRKVNEAVEKVMREFPPPR